MDTIDLTDATVTIGGVNVSGFVRGITFADEHTQALETRIAMLPSFTMRFRGTVDAVHPRTYRTLLGRQHPRVRRMHAAYGRRRGRGCW